MMTGITNNGEMKNVKVNDEGKVQVDIEGVLPVDIQGETVNIIQTSDREVTLLADVLTLSTSNTTIPVNKKVTNIMLANYSEEADVSVSVGSKTLEIGANLALEFPMNENITNLVLTATAADTKVQLVVKGVEDND